MINFTELESQLELYAMLFTEHQPRNTKSLSYQLFMQVNAIIQKQIASINDLDDLNNSIILIDKFIRQLKAEYGHINSNLNELEYPNFISKLSSLKVGSLIVGYHRSITHLLKLLLFIFSHSDGSNRIASLLDEHLKIFIKDLQTELPQLKKFQDIKNFEISDQSKLLKRIKQKQLDIIFDDEY